MADPKPSFFARIILAWVAYFRTLFDADFAGGVIQLRRGALPVPTPEEPVKAPEPAPPRIEEKTPDAALQLLALLQREGRLVDFLEDDVADASDEDLAAAARVVHEGCRKALHEHFTLAPVHPSEEGDAVTVEKGFDAAAIKLTGQVVGEPPFRGELTHRGWKVSDVRLPKVAEGHDVTVVQPAEVTL